MDSPFKIVGYNLDGVLCELFQPDKSFMKCNGEERKERKKLKLLHIKTAKKLRDTEGDEIYIVTARKDDVRFETIQWLKKNNIKYHKLLMLQEARTRRNIIDFKQRMIEYYHIDIFYEDDPKIVRALSKRLKNVNVILIENLLSKPVLEKDLRERLKSFNEDKIVKNSP